MARHFNDVKVHVHFFRLKSFFIFRTKKLDIEKTPAKSRVHE